ncbi:hypothetical protein [Secundilactobacillus silagei]|nr:hypothetical protein [Secundilactobacillus silagei]
MSKLWQIDDDAWFSGSLTTIIKTAVSLNGRASTCQITRQR